MTLNRNTSLAIALLLAPALSLAAAAAAHAAEGAPSDVASEVASDFGPEIVTDRPADMARRVENRDRVIRFLENGDYLHWPHDPHIRPTGDLHQTPEGKLISGMTHHRVRVYYSPDVAEWLRDGRPADAVLPDGAMIVKEMYQSQAPLYPDPDPVIGWAAMVKKNDAAFGGWYWLIEFKEAYRTMATMGQFSYSYCMACHASTASENTFASLDNLTGANAAAMDGRSVITVAEPFFFKDIRIPSMAGPMPKHDPDPGFRDLFMDPSIYPDSSPPGFSGETAVTFPDRTFDHAWDETMSADGAYITSDNCVGCHDATLLVDTEIPNMLLKHKVSEAGDGPAEHELLNLSVYGEWMASPMGMAGRDPVFYAQLEAEVANYPEHATFIQNTCLSCHGAMGQRQYSADTGKDDFDLAMAMATEGDGARYGALARDGVSCLVCHQMDPASIPGTTTGRFTRHQSRAVFGPTSPDEDPGGPLRTWPMEQALGLTPAYDPALKTSELCGTCHTVALPTFSEADRAQEAGQSLTVIPRLSEAHEQDTYLEWLYSAYQNSNPDLPVDDQTAKTCQGCHMDGDFQGAPAAAKKVANVQNTSWPEPPAANLAPADDITAPYRSDTGRHTFFGMNLFVLHLYQQFRDSVFQTGMDTNVPADTVDPFDFAIRNGQWQIANRTADIEILDLARDGADLVAQVKVINKAGHRLPSGVGFRRAWLSFEVTDPVGEVLWASGRTDERGVITGPEGAPLHSEFTRDWRQLQPHWQTITRQDQVQIYEERYVSGRHQGGRLTTSFLGIAAVAKDNQLLPLGYAVDHIEAKLAEAGGAGDPDAIGRYKSLLPVSRFQPPPGAESPRLDGDFRDHDGADIVTYRIPLSEIDGAAHVRTALSYQSLPPYYLRDVFASSDGAHAETLFNLVSRVDTEGTPIENWTITVVEDDAAIPQ